MKMVVDMEKSDFEKAIAIYDVRISVKAFLDKEYSCETTIEEFLKMNGENSVIEIMDTVEYDVEKSFARLLDMYCIPYSRFILINEENAEDDKRSILDARDIFDGLDIYSVFQGEWVH